MIRSEPARRAMRFSLAIAGIALYAAFAVGVMLAVFWFSFA